MPPPAVRAQTNKKPVQAGDIAHFHRFSTRTNRRKPCSELEGLRPGHDQSIRPVQPRADGKGEP